MCATGQWRRNEFESGGAKVGAPITRHIFGVVRLRFLALKVQLVVLVSAFVMVSTVWPVSCLLFFYSRCPPPPYTAICKSGGTCTPCLMESAPLPLDAKS